MARQANGQWLIRIENIDRLREIKGAAKVQIETLKAFGMESDEGIVWQSQRSDRYSQVLQTLLDSGDAFECFCSRKDLNGNQEVHRFCVAQRKEKQPAIRLKIPDVTIQFTDQLQGEFSQVLGSDVGDMVLKRADGFWAYQLAAVVDDADQKITHVVRGLDLLSSTPKQIYLQQKLGFPTPQHAHLPLVVDKAGYKLSKSLSACPIDPADPIPALRWVWQHLGQRPEDWPQNGSPEHVLMQAAARFEAVKIPSHAQLQTA